MDLLRTHLPARVLLSYTTEPKRLAIYAGYGEILAGGWSEATPAIVAIAPGSAPRLLDGRRRAITTAATDPETSVPTVLVFGTATLAEVLAELGIDKPPRPAPHRARVAPSVVMDAVYPIAGGRHGNKRLGSVWGDLELRYSLRSLEANFPNLGRVFLVGHKPAWATNVVWLPAEDAHRRNKDANLIDKVRLACRSGVSSTFLRLSDDQCILRPWDGLEAYHAGEATASPGAEGGKWWRRMDLTCQYLKQRGRPTYFYDTHTPQPVDRAAFLRVMGAANYQHPPGFCINTLYHNSVDIPRTIIGARKASFDRPTNLPRLRSRTARKTFLGYSEPATNQTMVDFLQTLFPTPSKYEL